MSTTRKAPLHGCVEVVREVVESTSCSRVAGAKHSVEACEGVEEKRGDEVREDERNREIGEGNRGSKIAGGLELRHADHLLVPKWRRVRRIEIRIVGKIERVLKEQNKKQ